MMEMKNEMNQEFLDLIDRYIAGQLSPSEKIHFEELLQSDADLKKKAEDHQSFLELLVEYSSSQQLKQQLNRIHASIPVSEYADLLMPKPTLIYQIWKRYRVGIAIAASMGVLAISLILHYMNQEKLNGQSSQVTALRRKLDKILLTQPSNSLRSSSKHQSISNSRDYQFGGTAFLVESKGYLITNYHVLEGSDSVYVQNRIGESFKTLLAYSNKTYDLAILKILDSSFNTNIKLPYSFSQSKPELSESVFTMGYPRDEIVYNQGYLSALSGFQGDTLNYQVSIAVNPGNSGGPILDNKGNIIGILSAKQTSADGVAYAVRSLGLYHLASLENSDSLLHKIMIANRNHKSNSLAGLNRSSQIKKIQDCIYMVKVY